MADSFDPVSPDSQKFLEQVKKGKPRNFALVTKGVKVLALLVKKKPIKAAEAKELKKASKGQKIFIGVVDGKGQDLTFKLKAEDADKPPGKELMLKDFLLSKAEFKCKPKYEIVTELAIVEELETTEDVEMESSEGDPTRTTIEQALQELEPKLREFLQAFPDRRTEILKPWKLMKDFAEAAEGASPVDAETALETVRGLLADLPGESTTHDTSGRDRKKLAAALGKLTPLVKPAITDHPERREEVLKQVADIKAIVEGEDEPNAKEVTQMLLGLGRLLRELTGIATGVVEQRKFLITRFQEIPLEIKPHLDSLKTEIIRLVPNDDAGEVINAIEVQLQALYDELREEVDKSINAGDPSLLQGLKQRVLSHELVNHLMDSPLPSVDGSQFRAAILSALEEVEQKIAG